MSKIRDLRIAAGLSQQALAERVGTSQPQIKRLEAGDRSLSKRWAERLATPLRTTPEELMFGKIPPKNEQSTFAGNEPNAVVGPAVIGRGKTIPVYGQAVGGINGEFVMNGIAMFEVLAPPGVSEADGAYAVTVSGESMSPRYEDGEVCYVDPTRRVKRGDYVVAQIQQSENGPVLAFVKKFCRHNAAELVLEQLNPEKEMRFDAEHVVSVHYIALAGPANWT